MLFQPSRKLILPLVVLCLTFFSACEQDEIAPLEDAMFRINISDEFIVNHHQHVIIISDYDGEVLVTKKLNTRGLHELAVPGRRDGTYHVTLFDGNRSFKTFASVPPDEYAIDVWKSESPARVGSHSLLLEDPSLPLPMVSGENLQFFTTVSREKIDLNLTQSSSDIYLLYERNNEPHFIYFPSLAVNESTTITAQDFANGQTLSKKSVKLTPNLGGPNITLSASIEADDRKMEYFLSNSNGEAHVLIPELLMPKLKFFATTFVGNGNIYTLVGPEIATEQKVLWVIGGVTQTTPSSVFYSIETSGTMLRWTGSSPTLSWEIISQPGGNIMVNLPRLSQEFQFGYSFGDLRALKFVMASVIKDTRYSNYQEFVKSSLKNDYPVFTTSYELFTQEIPLPE